MFMSIIDCLSAGIYQTQASNQCPIGITCTKHVLYLYSSISQFLTFLIMESPNITGQYSSTHVVTYWQLTILFTVVRAAPADQILTTHRTAPAWADIWCGHWIYSSQYEKTNTSFFNSLSPKNPQLSQCSWCRVAHGNFLTLGMEWLINLRTH